MTPAGMVGKFLILVGSITVLLGLVLVFAGRIPFLGRLPGDVVIQRRSFSFYFPIATGILLSLVLSLILWFLTRK
jgi:hypothetical protein